MKSDVRLLKINPQFEQVQFRVPLKFGTGIIRSITSLTVGATVENRDGHTGDGFGNILLSDIWAFPSAELSHEHRDQAMKAIATRFCHYLSDNAEFGHPIDLYMQAKPQLDEIRADVQADMQLPEEIPVLAALVSASPADAAIHDAFGHANGICTYDGYGPDFMDYDLSRWCGPEWAGRYIADYIHDAYKPRLPIFHLVGGMDKLTEAEIEDTDPHDGLPVSLDQWIERDGLRCFKVKLRGTDIDWDVERTTQVAEVIQSTYRDLGIDRPFYLSTDSNELNESPQTVLEYLHKLREACPIAFDSLLYLEQPTERDLQAHRFDMSPVSNIKPVVVDEGVTDLEKLQLARELGWAGIGLKTCKGHSSSLLYVAVAAQSDMVMTVQDLTNPGRSLLHSAGLAARIDTLKGVEYNARQYIPKAAMDFQNNHSSLFDVRDGTISTDTIGHVGLGY